MKRIVMTGPTGTIGMALINLCLEERIEVFAICRPNSERLKNIPDSYLIHRIECDLNYLQVLSRKDIPKSDIFYHFGWAETGGEGRDNMDSQLRNVQYTLEAVRLAKRIGCGTFVGAGSQAEYGNQPIGTMLNAHTPTFPESGYGSAKLCAGKMSQIECQKLGLRHVWVRILSVYGPYNGDNSMIISTIKKMLSGERISLTAGDQEWDYLYSKDAARALLLVGKQGMNKKIYCLGSGQTKKIREYVKMIAI